MTQTSYQSLFSLDGRVAVITGGAGLLGREFACGLAQHGARVVLLDIDRVRLKDAVRETAQRTGAVIESRLVDITSPASVAPTLDDLAASIGPIDILLNNAQSASPDAAAYFAPFESYDFAEWRRVMAVDLDGMAIVAQAACRQMTRLNRGGSLIQIGSIYGCYGPDNRIYEGAEYKGVPINNPAVYSVAKAGVVGLTKWLATTYAKNGIRSNAVIPGGIESGQNAEFVRRYANRVPLGRMARKEEIVGAVVWLASQASQYVTGQTIFVDGGLSAW